MAVLSGKADAYIHVGKLHEWDVAAPAAVLKQRGLHVSRLDGAPLRFNQRDPSLSECADVSNGHRARDARSACHGRPMTVRWHVPFGEGRKHSVTIGQLPSKHPAVHGRPGRAHGPQLAVAPAPPCTTAIAPREASAVVRIVHI